MDYLADPAEDNALESWSGVKGLIANGAEKRFGPGTEQFLLEADRRQSYMKVELFRRYGLNEDKT